MRVIVAGGRNYNLSSTDYKLLDYYKVALPITELVSGGATGADSCGESWAVKNNIKKTVFPANWQLYGKSAGYKRNKEMALYADAVILFHGGKGTELMYKLATEHNLYIIDKRN